MNQKEYWKKKWETSENEPENNFARRCFALITPYHKTVLDLGCGDGRDSVFFAKKGLTVTAIDFSESGIKKLNEKVHSLGLQNILAMQMDIRKISFPENSFDIIYAHLSIHYFDNGTTTKIFYNLYRMLTVRGLIFIKLLNANPQKMRCMGREKKSVQTCIPATTFGIFSVRNT